MDRNQASDSSPDIGRVRRDAILGIGRGAQKIPFFVLTLASPSAEPIRVHRVFYLAAPSQSILAEWVSAIREAMPSDEEARANAEAENEPVLMCGYLNKMGGSRKVRPVLRTPFF